MLLMFQISCYATSIWDETLYNAWSRIMSLLIPNVGQLKLKLKKFADHINADEARLNKIVCENVAL